METKEEMKEMIQDIKFERTDKKLQKRFEKFPFPFGSSGECKACEVLDAIYRRILLEKFNKCKEQHEIFVKPSTYLVTHELLQDIPFSFERLSDSELKKLQEKIEDAIFGPDASKLELTDKKV